MDNNDYLIKKNEIELYKNDVIYPLLKKVSKLTGFEIKSLLRNAYSLMQTEYYFSLTQAQIEFSEKYNFHIEANGINVVSSCIEYQKLFKKVIGDIVRCYLIELQQKEAKITELLNKEFSIEKNDDGDAKNGD